MATMVKGTDEQLTQAPRRGRGADLELTCRRTSSTSCSRRRSPACGERMRHQLALFLHDHHARTDLRTRGMLEPDSLGGWSHCRISLPPCSDTPPRTRNPKDTGTSFWISVPALVQQVRLPDLPGKH